MKRNKTKGRSGKSPYARYGKKPCAHCQQLTAQDRAAAARGEPLSNTLDKVAR